MLKKIISLSIALVMLMGTLGVNASGREYRRVADFSSMSAIVSSGMPASSVYTKTGNFTLKWAGSDLNRNITVPTQQTDFSSCDYLEFYINSTAKTGMNITIGLISDDPDTVCLDYYYTTIKADFTGWKFFSLPFKGEKSVFSASSSPLGLYAVSQIRLWSSFGGSSPVEGTELYVDSFYITDQKSEVTEEAQEAETYTILNLSVAENIAAAGFPASSEQTKSGDVSLKWAEPNLKKSLSHTGFDGDWSAYNCLALDMYNKDMNGSTLTLLVYSENDDTDGGDYYQYRLSIDFIGWKKVLIPWKDFTTARTPKGWDQITSFSIATTWSATAERPTSLMDGTELYIDKIYLTTEENVFDDTVDYVIPSFTYDDHTDMVSKIKELHGDDAHPRLLFNQQELDEIKERIKTDVYAKKSYEAVIKEADKYIDQPVETYVLTDGALARTSESRLPALAMAYLLSGDARYKDRLWAEIESICSFPNWNPQKMLDIGNHGLPMAIAYDWLYDDWTPQQRRTIRNALVRHCIEPGLSHLRVNSAVFASDASNWNQVCNGGIGLAALAIGDEEGYEALANEVINLTCRSLPVSLEVFAPDGGTHEGVTYWEYGLGWFFVYHNSLMTACGYDLGLSEMSGLSETGYFPISLMGPTKQTFNYGDATSSTVSSHIFHWLARLYDKPEFVGYKYEVEPNGGGAYDLAMYRPFDETPDFTSIMPLDKMFVSADYVASTRSSWIDQNALFAAYIAGDNQTGHGDMDIGSFVLDALGTRWITDFGQDDYWADGAFDFSVGGTRWKYYRKGAEGHNVVVMNPSKIASDAPYREGQNPLGKGEIETFKSSKQASYGVIDMTDAYSRDVSAYKRGFALINNRSQFVIRDEIKTLKPSDVYSFFHTQQKIHIADSKTAYMYTGIDFEHATTMLRVDLVTDAENAEFREMKAEKFSFSDPLPEGVTGVDNSAYRKLTVYIPSASDPTINIVFTPMLPGQSEPVINEIKTIASWDDYLSDVEMLTSLTVDGIPVDSFTTYNTNYSVNAGMVGVVEATGANGVTVSIKQAQKIGDTAVVTATDSRGNTNNYTVTFTEIQPSGDIEASPVAAVRASDVPEPENVPENTFDGDITTRWAADSADGKNGEQWIIWDMGEEIEFDTVYLAFWKGNVRNQKFKLQLSNDDANYVTVFDGQSAGNSEALQPYSVGSQKARYIKFVGYGNTANTFNSVNEFVIPKNLGNFADMQNHWAAPDVSQFANAGIVKGISETEFAPESKVTRAEFAELLYRTMELEDAAAASAFADVYDTDWYFNSINVLYSMGYIPDEMIQDGSFSPNKPITREEITALIIRAYEANVIGDIKTYGLDRFTDKGEVSAYAADYVDKALTLHIIKGVTDSSFAPKDNATRAQAVVILKRFFSLLNNA